MNLLKLTREKLSVDGITEQVVASSCGAISVFVGTTRDNFDDKEVVSLEYEAYESMGVKAMEGICVELRKKWPEVENIAIYHRLGLVPVKEASIVIAISAPHRQEAIQATEWCINNVKQSVPIWKKEIYSDSKPQWKENKEYPIPKLKKRKFKIDQKVEAPNVPLYLVQIKASNSEINERIERYMARKREEINVHNIKEFCRGDRKSEYTCCRIDAVFQKRKDSKSHLKVNRVMNSYSYRDQKDSKYMTKYIPSNGVEERISNIECQLSLTTPTPKNIYLRLKSIEDRLLHLESISPEYIQFWDRMSTPVMPAKKKIFSLEELDELITETEKTIRIP